MKKQMTGFAGKETVGCGRCQATGTVVVTDWVPYGMTNVAMDTGVECPDCLEKGLCPKCGSRLNYPHNIGICSSADCDFVDQG